MTKYIAFSRSAADEIIADRFLQSTEFEAGIALVGFLQGVTTNVRLSPKIRIIPSDEGYFINSLRENSKEYVIFDTEKSGLFLTKYKDSDVVLHLQKTLRFCTKFWGNMKPSANELFLISSTKAVVFPHPISQQTSVRISLELAPDSKRLAKRGEDRRYILVYRCGTDDGGGPHEAVRLANFRKFLEALPAVVQQPISEDMHTPNITSLNVTSLEDHPPAHLDAYQGYQRWLQFLTRAQRAFVEADLQAPHRIEGPAGTGKTISLILKCVSALRKADLEGREYRALFVTHSDATRRTIKQIIDSNDPWQYSNADVLRLQGLKLTTLHQLCAELLRQDIYETEFIDRDAMESKQLQLLYVHEAIATAFTQDLPTYQKLLSPDFGQFLNQTDRWTLAEIVQHEISVVIRGRSEEKLDNYRKLPRLRYGLPAETTSDRGFVWQIFRRYQDQLQSSAQFDTDDIVLTTTGQLNTPIWRRRRLREGYDAIFIDETHLFNLNELSLFHHLPRGEASFPIAYSVDRSQAVGDRGWDNDLLDSAFPRDRDENHGSNRTEVNGIFRCSPEIVDLAFSVTSAGATLFTNFEDPLLLAQSMFTSSEERKCAPPVMYECANDATMVATAFARAERMSKEMEVPRSGIAVVTFSEELFQSAVKYAEDHNKPFEQLKERGDIEVVQRAQQTGRFVLALPDYIGGLEFDGVVLVGVDDGRVPPTYTLDSAESRNFLSYTSHNRLYVAITRAKYRIEVLACKERGLSSLLRNAMQKQILMPGHLEDDR